MPTHNYITSNNFRVPVPRALCRPSLLLKIFLSFIILSISSLLKTGKHHTPLYSDHHNYHAKNSRHQASLSDQNEFDYVLHKGQKIVKGDNNDNNNNIDEILFEEAQAVKEHHLRFESRSRNSRNRVEDEEEDDEEDEDDDYYEDEDDDDEDDEDDDDDEDED